MKISHLLALITLCLILANSTIIITQPAITNIANNQLQYWFANFGIVHYNKPMSFSLFYTNSTLCGGTEDPNLKPFTTPTYILAKQGSCSFPKKSVKAQSLGAQGIIFGSRDVDYARGNVVLSDDGTGRKVKITPLFVSLQDLEKLSNLTNPKIKVNFQLSQRNYSQVDLFLSASGRQNYIFLRNFRDYYNSIANNIKLNVVYHTIQCKSCSPSECILQGNCCTFDMDNYQSDLGKYIIQEQFRQYKLFLLFSQNKQLDKWFEYMDKFDKTCDYDWINSEQCSKRIYESLGVSKLKNIDQFDAMMEWRALQTKTGIISLPDISVNGMRHVQLLTADSAFSMICESLSEQITPCNPDANKNSNSNNRGGIIAAIVISSIVLILIGIYCYRKVIRRQITNDMASKVSQLVAKYAAKVSEQKKKRRDKLMERMTEQL